MQYLPINFPDDFDTVKKVVQSAFSSTSDSSLSEWLSFSEMEKMIIQKRGMCIKAVDSRNNIIGSIYAQQENPINGREGLEKWVIVALAVNPNDSGKGIGSGLIKAMEQYAKKHGAIKMFAYTNKEDDRVVHFYKNNGYQDAGWIKDYQYGKDNSAIFLLKYL